MNTKREQLGIHTSVKGLNRRQILWLTATGLTVAVLLLVAFLPPFVGADARELIMRAFRNVCHQLPSRSFHIGTSQVALCHRCVGIYAALPPALILFSILRQWDGLLSRYPLQIIAASLVPLAVDWGADLVGLWANTPVSRLVTGAIFGVVAGYHLARGVVKAAGAQQIEVRGASAEAVGR